MQFPAITLPTVLIPHLALVLSPVILLGILILFGIFYLIISSILFYHWTSYGMGSHGIHVGEVMFVSVSVLVFLVAFLTASYY